MAIRRLVLLSVCLMFSQMALSSIRPMTSYRLLALGESIAAIGWISALTAFAPLVLALPSGRVAARGFAAWVGVVGSLIFTVGCLGLSWGTAFAELAWASVLLGAGNVGQMVAFQTLIASETAEVDYDRNYGWYAAGASLGQLIGPLVGTRAFELMGGGLEGTTIANLISTGGAAVGLVLSLLLLVGARSARAAHTLAPDGRQASVREALAHPGAVPSIYVSMIIIAAIDLISVYLPVLGDEKGWSAGFVGLLLVIRAGCSVLSRLVLGLLCRLASRQMILLVTVSITAVLCALVPATGPQVAPIVLMAIMGLTMGVGQPMGMAWTVAAVPADARSTAIALRLIGNRVGQVFIPAASSMIVALGGTAAVFWLLGALLASSAGAVAAAK